MWEATYQIAPHGLATSFTESELPLEYAARFRNRYINAAGGAEKRPGMAQFGNTITGNPKIDGLHELIQKDGTAWLFASGGGALYRYDDPAWTKLTVASNVRTLLNSTARLRSVQMGDKLIFCNGVDRNFYTTDGTNFFELKAIIESGEAATSTSAKALYDSDIVNWISQTDVVANDLVFTPNRAGYGLVTSVTTAFVAITPISGAALGLGKSTFGGDFGSGALYEIADLVELNIIPNLTDNPHLGEKDNVALAGPGTTAVIVAVSGVNFSTTDIRVGDIVSNTTMNAVTDVLAVSASLNVTPISGQAAGDSLVFLKPAMPISTFMHVHYGRLYHIDERDKQLVRISGVDDPQDMTTDAGTLDSQSFSFGALQPRGDALLSMASFQSFLGILGNQNLYLYTGTNPIDSSTTANDSDFSPVGVFPQGGLSERGLLSIGNDLAFVTHDGVQTVSQIQDRDNLNRANLTEPIRKTLREQLRTEGGEQIQLIHYPPRSWLMLKVGSLIYNYNYSAFVGQKVAPQEGDKITEGSWSLFDGKFAQCHSFYFRANGTLICGGDSGKVYIFDQGDFDDDGDTITTEYQTGWLAPAEDTRISQGKYIKPQIQAGSNTAYTIRAEAPYAVESSDEIDITASGTTTPIGLFVIGESSIGAAAVANIKYPLRWRGESVRLTFETNDTMGPDTLSRYTLYGVIGGRE